MKLTLPKLEQISDIRKYLMVIESLEVNKLNNAMSVNSKIHQNVQNIEQLKSMKQYYGDMTEFLLRRQTFSRMDECEAAFVRQIEDFLTFWKQTMDDFKKLSNEEMESALQKNVKLRDELNELLEKTLGFTPPPNSLLINLVTIRKLASKVGNNESTQYLNFDHMKKHNIKVNQDWIRDRKLLINQKLENFEKRLETCLAVTKDKLNLELMKLHGKRLAHFDKLMIRYNKIKQTVYKVSAKEMAELKKLKKFFLLRHSVPLYYHQNEFMVEGMNNQIQTTEVFENVLGDFEEVKRLRESSSGKNKGKKRLLYQGGKEPYDIKKRNIQSRLNRTGYVDKDASFASTHSSHDLCKTDFKNKTQHTPANKIAGKDKRTSLKV